MTDFRVFLKLLIIMTVVSLSAIIITTVLLYLDAVNGREEILTQVAGRYRRALTSAVELHQLHMTSTHREEAKINKDYALAQVTKIITRASELTGLRGDIELTVAFLDGDKIKFISPNDDSLNIEMGSDLAIPMQLALSGQQGTIRGYDYNGNYVLAAFTRVDAIPLGVVAKSKTQDINVRFVKGAIMAVVPAVILVLLGAYYFYRTTNYIVERLRSDNLRFRRMARELAESEQRLQCFFDAAFEGIVITENEIFVDCNRRFADMFGYSMDEIVEMSIMDLVHPDDYAMVSKHIKNEYVESYEHRSIHKDGRVLYCEVHGRMSQLKGRKIRITAVHDLKERIKRVEVVKELAERKRQTSKMEAIGNFASGIAHDFNNTLTPIIGNCDLLFLKVKEDDPVYGNLTKIYQAAGTAQLLVRRMQSFARKESASKEVIPLKVDACIEEAFEFLRSITPKSINLETGMDSDLGMVSTTDVMIRQILMNLVKNSAHAIGDNPGTISIDVYNETIHLERFNLSAGRYVKIEVKDDGCGMPEEVLECALDPYFTTKNEEGTGLGLAVVRGILENHEGLIHLQSEEHLGTKATVYLPCVEASAAAERRACNLDDPIPLGNGQRILFVDDETAIANMAKDVLTTLRYEVSVESDSKAALREFALNPTKYDCLMTDLTMPHMGGIELITEVKKINPELKIILSSGLGSNGKYRAEMYANIINIYIEKPVTRREYARVLNELFS